MTRTTRYRETRTERFSISVTPTLLAKLDEFAYENRWARSVAVEVLIERGLAGWEPSGEPGDGVPRRGEDDADDPRRRILGRWPRAAALGERPVPLWLFPLAAFWWLMFWALLAMIWLAAEPCLLAVSAVLVLAAGARHLADVRIARLPLGLRAVVLRGDGNETRLLDPGAVQLHRPGDGKAARPGMPAAVAERRVMEHAARVGQLVGQGAHHGWGPAGETGRVRQQGGGESRRRACRRAARPGS